MSAIALGTSTVAAKSSVPTPTVQITNPVWEDMQLQMPAAFQSELNAEWLVLCIPPAAHRGANAPEYRPERS